MLRDELMAEVGGGMEEDRGGGSGGNPSTGRRRHGPKCEDFCIFLPAIAAALFIVFGTQIFCAVPCVGPSLVSSLYWFVIVYVLGGPCEVSSQEYLGYRARSADTAHGTDTARARAAGRGDRLTPGTVMNQMSQHESVGAY